MESQWPCGSCTFLNRPLALVCEICDAPKPQTYGSVGNSIDLTSDSESDNEDLKKALALSLTHSQHDTDDTIRKKGGEVSLAVKNDITIECPETKGILSAIVSLQNSTSKRGSDMIETTTPLYKQIKSGHNPRFETGQLGLTFVSGYSRTSTTFTFSELVESAHLKKACLSTFVINDDWLFGSIPRSIKLCIAMSRPQNEIVRVSCFLPRTHPILMTLYRETKLL
jgi:hypothetical protein